MAVLPTARAKVWVGPPLLAREPRLREALATWVPLPQVLSSARLPPLSVIVPRQSGDLVELTTAELATMVLASVAVPEVPFFDTAATAFAAAVAAEGAVGDRQRT